MKYLKITKLYCNHPTDYTWHLQIADGYLNDYKYRKSNMLADKLLKVYNGEMDTVKHNCHYYEMNLSKFKVRGYPVGLVYKDGSNIPCFLWYKGYGDNEFCTDYSLIIDENIELFEEYGYIVKRHNVILEDHTK